MEFKKEQLTTISRYRNSIEVAKITDIKGNDLTIERFNGKTLHFPISHAEGYEIGQYIDIQYFKTGDSSYTLKLIGVTPKEFISDNK